MPTYEFRCPDGHDFEKFYRSISAAPSVVACPVCGKTAERQLSAGAGLVFKGSGFYITDYGKDGKKPQTPPAAKEGGASGEKAPKSESAPAADSGSSKAKPDAATKPASDSGSSKKAKGSE
jgi:putative FmdB family regulatory protein